MEFEAFGKHDVDMSGDVLVYYLRKCDNDFYKEQKTLTKIKVFLVALFCI